MRTITSDQISEKTIKDFIPRTESQLEEVKSDVLNIISEVKASRDDALIKFSSKFDKIELKKSDIRVSEAEFKEAYEIVDKKLLVALKHAKANLIKFHRAQLRTEWTIEVEKGVNAGQVYRPLESVGLYIPGGRAIYPSTVLMAATPARVAGVKKIIMCSPPQKNKKIAPEILVAAREFEINDVFKCGGAQAIAAMAYGTDTVPCVQKVIGPGNKYVNAAKQILSNVIAIDTPAGPSEILIIADDSANYEYVIADFVSQIEHDPDNIGILISTSNKLIDSVKENLNSYIEKCDREEILKIALEKNALFVIAKDLEDCARICNIIAPEHLEILIKNPKEMLKSIQSAGAIFLGEYSPVPLGDYCAGTNHILPTGGNAKRYSGLSVNDFLKVMDVLECTKEGLMNLYPTASTIAEFERLDAHRKSIEQRLKEKNK